MMRSRGIAWMLAQRGTAVASLARGREGCPRPSAADGPPSRDHRLDVVVVTHNSAGLIEKCLAALRIALERSTATLIVVDNASTDATVATVSQLGDRLLLLHNDTNVGFAAAANRALRGTEADFVLLVNPDVVVNTDAVESLLSVARRFPESGIYGGQARLVTGAEDPFSRLPAPTLASAIGFAIGVSALRLRFAEVRRRGVARAASQVRPVDALCAALMLVSADVWRKLGGFNERFVLYGEDVDLCQRARRLGHMPLQVTGAQYLHLGGASSSQGERLRLILTGQATLYQMYLRPWRTKAALAALTAGAAMRASVAAVLPSGRFRHWCHVWRERNQWRRGWPKQN